MNDFLQRHVPGLPKIRPGAAFGLDAEDCAVVYLRVSGRSQVDTDYDPEGNSLPTQREASERMSAEMGKTIVRYFIEPGVSALPLDKRPEFRAMIEWLMETRAAKYVIVYDLSRFARNAFEYSIVGVTFQTLGVQLISAKELNGDSPQIRLMRNVTAAINQFRSESSGEDIKEKIAHKARTGGTISQAPLGYLNVRELFEGRKINTVKIDDERAPYVQMVFQLYSTGRYSIEDVQQIVTERGLRTRPTKKFPAGNTVAVNTIANMLHNRYYCGVIVHEGVEYPSRHEALIDDALFDKCQKVLQANHVSGTRRRIHHHPLKGLLGCARCKRRFLLAKATGNGGIYLYMYCAGRKQDKSCDMPYVALDSPNGIEAAMSAHYRTMTVAPEHREELTAYVDEAMATHHGISDHMRAQLQKQLAALETRENGLFALVGNPDWDQAKLTAQMKQVRTEKEQAEAQLSNVGGALDTGRDIIITALAMLAQPGDVYDNADDAEKTLLTKSLFEGLIYVDADEDGHARITGSTLAAPFDDLRTVLAAPHAPAEESDDGPDDTNPGAALLTRLAPWEPGTHNSEGDPLPRWETITLTDQAVRSANGSTKHYMVGDTGFEPVTSSV